MLFVRCVPRLLVLPIAGKDIDGVVFILLGCIDKCVRSQLLVSKIRHSAVDYRAHVRSQTEQDDDS